MGANPAGRAALITNIRGWLRKGGMQAIRECGIEWTQSLSSSMAGFLSGRVEMSEEEINKALGYERRWQVESFMTGMRWTMSSVLNARAERGLMTDAALKVLAYAIQRQEAGVARMVSTGRSGLIVAVRTSSVPVSPRHSQPRTRTFVCPGVHVAVMPYITVAA